MKDNPRKTGQCIICQKIKTYHSSYAHQHPEQDYNRRLIQGESLSKLAADFGCDYRTMKKHRENCLPRKQKEMFEAREVKAGLDLVACQQKVWDDAQEAIDYALGRKVKPTKGELNLAVFGQCIAPQVKIIEVLAKVGNDKDDDIPGIDRAIAKMKELRDGK